MDQTEDKRAAFRRGIQTAEGSMDFDEFTDHMSDLLSKAWGSDWGTFTQEEPLSNNGSEETPIPVITFDTFERVPSKSHKSPDPILFDKIVDPTDQRRSIKVYRQWFDLEAEFKIYHTSNKEARILMEDLETFLFTYKAYFKNKGISDICFAAELQPKVESRWSKDLATRTLRYLVRIERILTIHSHNLQEVDVCADPFTAEATTPVVTHPPTFMDMYSRINSSKDE